MRTTSDISACLGPIEEVIKDQLLPALTEISQFTDKIRKVFSLSPKEGCLGISNPVEISDY